MQRTLILALLIICSFCAFAQQKDKIVPKKQANVGATGNGTTTVTPVDHSIANAPAAPPSANDIYKQIGGPMPPIRVVYPKKAVYTENTLKNDANLFVMIFNPTCEHCEEMAFNLEQSLNLFKKSHIVLMATPGMGPYLEFFENGTKVQKYPKIKMGLDSAGFIERTYNDIMLPQINIYNADRKLIKSFSGITTIDSLKQYIQ